MTTAPFDPLLFLDLADELSAAGDEAHLRAAVGRAYYALFLLARTKVGITGTNDVHKRVRQALKKRGLRSAADQLGAFSRLRGVADYQMIPDEVARRDWLRNWSDAQQLVRHLMPTLR
jgi:hypothetical protein